MLWNGVNIQEVEQKDQAQPDKSKKVIEEAANSEYKYGFTSDIDTEIVPPGLNEDVVRFISATKGEPDWLLEYRLKAFRYWQRRRHGRILTYPK